MRDFLAKAYRQLEHHVYLRKIPPDKRKLVQEVRRSRLTYLSPKKFVQIIKTCEWIEAHEVPGTFIEAGCALGGSSIVIATIKSDDRPLDVYDVFDMIPPPSREDTADVHERYEEILAGDSTGIGGDTYYGYMEDLIVKVEQNLKAFDVDLELDDVNLIEGKVQDTLQPDTPVAFAHIDVDWYDPVRTSLERIYPVLSPGGSIILDDYNSWGGCRKATNEFLDNLDGNFITDNRYGSMKITKG